MIDSTRFVKAIKEVAKSERNANLNDQASKASLDPSYPGGAPKIVEAGAVGTYEHSILRPYFWGFPTASEDVLKQPIGDADVLMGKVYDIPTNLIYNDKAFYLLPKDYPEANTTVANTSATSVKGLKVLIPAPILVAAVSFEVVSATASALAAIGIYSSDKNNLLINTGAVDCSTNGVKETTLGTPYQLLPGWYWFMYTLNDTSTTLRAIAMGGNIANVMNQGTVQRGQAANSASAAVLPATLGTITALAFNAPLCKLQA